MAIRITQNMLNNNMLRNLHNSMGNMDKLQEQLSSGRKVNRPSDDPVIATRGMYYRSSLIENEQYQRNADEASSWMDITDQTMDEIGNIFKRVSELLVYSGNGGLSTEDRQTMAMEITELKNQLGNLANTTVNGRYIFAGTDTTTPPYNPTVGDFTNTNAGEVKLEMSQNVFVPINVNPQAIFNYPDNANNVFKVLDNIIAELNAGNSAAHHDTALTKQTDNLLAERAALGARVNRIELVIDRLTRQEVTITELQSKNEDADEAEVITQLKMQESVHRAALAAGARVIQPTLLDFLR